MQPTLSSPPTAHRNVDVQWLRAVAALFVVLFHASHYLLDRQGDRRFIEIFDGRFGLIGVAIFFAISGALMAELVRRDDPGLFLAHRLVRIYPLFIAVAVGFSVLRSGGIDADIRALSLGLVGNRGIYQLGVEWTLILEIFFYVLLFLVAVTGLARFVAPLAVGWLGLILAAAFLDTERMSATILPTLLEAPFLPANAAFAGGLLVPSILRRISISPAVTALAIGLAMASFSVDLAYGRLLGAFVAVAVVAAAFDHGSKERRQGLFGGAAKLMGDSSYALYLAHVPIILIVYRFGIGPTEWQWLTAVLASVLVSIPLGLADVELYRRLRRLTDGTRRDRRLVAAWLYVAAYMALAVAFLFKQR